MSMHCPKCGNTKNFSTERRLNGDSTCLACSFKAPTARFQTPVTEIFGSGKTKPMPSPSLSPREYMVALAGKLEAEGGRDMTQGECKNLELAESTIRVQEVESSATTPKENPPGPFDNLTRVELVKKCESLSNQFNAIVDGCDTAWGIIANAKGWWPYSETPSEWVAAAVRWRDEFYHPMLDTLLRSSNVDPPGYAEQCIDVERPATREESPKPTAVPDCAEDCVVHRTCRPDQDTATPPASGEWVPRWVAVHLWKLLDDIDTYSDMFKDDYERLAKAVYRRQRLRFQVGTSDGYDVEFNGYSDPPRDTERRLNQSPSVPNCPPCPGDHLGGIGIQGLWEDLRDSALEGRISQEELFSMGFSRWNEEGDEAEGEDLFSGGTLWLMPVNWFDELPANFRFISINGNEVKARDASKDSRMGYLAFGIVWFEKPAK